MRITGRQLRQIIREEVSRQNNVQTLKEAAIPVGTISFISGINRDALELASPLFSSATAAQAVATLDRVISDVYKGNVGQLMKELKTATGRIDAIAGAIDIFVSDGQKIYTAALNAALAHLRNKYRQQTSEIAKKIESLIRKLGGVPSQPIDLS